jgi:DnaJ family protein C protein 28
VGDREDEPAPRRRTLRERECGVEQQIREAMERGEFDNLPGKGKPLDLGEEENTPENLRMAFKLLKDAGVAPEWIEHDKEIRARLAELRQMFDRHVRWEHARRTRIEPRTPDAIITEHARGPRSREQVIRDFRQRAAELNRAIDDFNLQAPSARVHHARIRIEAEIEEFRRRCLEISNARG